jgi:GNAT superfamily N-acetyltransferase
MSDIKFKNELPAIEKYFPLFLSTGWNDEYNLTSAQLNDVIQKSYFAVCAYDGDELIGFGRIVSDGILYAMVYEMIVNPAYQGKGIGKEILNRLIQKCKNENIRDIQLFCAKGKRGFYESCGFAARPEDAPGMQFKKEN